MRIISQDGTLDFPYEQISVYLQENVVLCHSMSDIGKHKVLGEYSTEEKAIKAMEMLREKYKKYISAKGMNLFFAFNHPKVFQFPQDDEVEV